MGNPPFIGSSLQTKQQKEGMQLVFSGVKKAGVLDFVSAWFLKAAQYIQGTKIKAAFVSTNSISQGEQVGVLWNELMNKYKIKIHFAHRTFRWNNEAKGNAAVHVIITGFANYDTKEKYLFDYEDIKGEPEVLKVSNINPYLIEGNDIFVFKRTKPISIVPEMTKGSSPTDGGYLLISDENKKEILAKEPFLSIYIKEYVGSKEFINNLSRWCFWLKDIEPKELRKSKELLKRLENVKKFRLASSKLATQKWSELPYLFIEERQPISDYLLIPRVSSENRKYIPIGYLDKNTIISDGAISLPNATFYLFGILTSKMHMTWVKYTCGRLKSDYRYSNTIVYNNYPFPKEINSKQKARVEKAAQAVLTTRLKYPDSSLADLYDSLAMPPNLVKAHNVLDKAVDLCYRPQAFVSERGRIEFLFNLYSQYITPLQAEIKRKKNRR